MSLNLKHADKHAMVVDDEPDIARLVQSVLVSAGFTVTCFSNGREAFESIQRHRPDLVVMDVSMPEMDGLECLKKIRADAATADLPVILLTARDELQDMIEGWAAGVDFYVTKPFKKQTLLKCIRRLLDGEDDSEEE